MMRSFGNRPDSFVTDEPFYSHYLKVTQLPHPGAAEVVKTHESDWRKVVEWLTGPIPEGKNHMVSEAYGASSPAWHGLRLDEKSVPCFFNP